MENIKWKWLENEQSLNILAIKPMEFYLNFSASFFKFNEDFNFEI